MLLVKLTTYRKLNISTLGRISACICLLGIAAAANAQDNSPLSRYGLGNQVPNTNVANRTMGGIAAAYNDYFNINYNNPSSYAFFQAFQEPNSRKLNPGRVVLNIGVETEARTLIDPNAKARFTSSNILFSNVMMGVPLRKNWGMAFGLRPLNRIGYKMAKTEVLKDPLTGQTIESSQTFNEGTGGANLASLGTGVKFKVGTNSFISIGANGGYLFGKKEYNNARLLFNDSTDYSRGDIQNKTGFGGLYYDAGLQYQFKISKKVFMGIGAYGNWEQKLKASKTSVVSNSYYFGGQVTGVIDTISQQRIDGNISLPQSYTSGFTIQKPALPGTNEGGWLIGADFTKSNWSQYRYYNQPDTSMIDNWQLKVGAELRPALNRNYFSQVSYRVGFFTGPDYIQSRGNISVYGISFGMGLPLNNYTYQARGQATLINLGFEYVKRGSDANLLKENLYRLSVGFSLSDMWFGKKRYN